MRLLLSGALLLAIPAWAVRRPRNTEEGKPAIEDIREQIRVASRIDMQIGEAEQNLAVAETAWKAHANAVRRNTPIAEQLRLEADAVKYTDSEMERLRMEVRRHTQLQLNEFSKAIAMTAKVYGLDPPQQRGISENPVTKGRTIAWTPVARTPGDRQVADNDGNWRRIRLPRKVRSGATYADGVVTIDPRTIRRGPEYLASTLYHERIHFEQLIDPAKMSLHGSELEYEAHKAEADHADDFFDPNTKAGRDEITIVAADLSAAQAEMDKYRNGLKGPMGVIRRLLPPQDLSGVFDRNVHTEEQLAIIQADADNLRKQVAAEFAARSESRLIAPPLQPAGPAAPEAPRQYPPAVGAPAGPSARTDNITNVTIRACRGEWPTPDDLQDFYQLSSDDAGFLMTLSALVSQDCTRLLLRRLLSIHYAHEVLSVQRLQEEAIPLLPPQAGDGTWEREPNQRPRDCVKRGVWYKECY